MEYAKNVMESRRESLNAPSEATYTNGRFVYQFVHCDRTIIVLDTFSGNQTLLATSTENTVGHQLTLTDLLVWTPSQLIALWTCDESSVYIGRMKLDFIHRKYDLEFSKIQPFDELVGSHNSTQLSVMDNDFVLMAAPRTDGTVIFSKYEVETTKIEVLGLANTNGHSLSGSHFHDGNIFFFGSLTAVDCHHAYCYDIRTRETRRMDFGPLDEQANPLNESESVRFSRRYLTVANGSYFLLVRTRAEDDYSNALHYDDEHDYTDDWNDQLDPKARLFHLDLNVGKWQEITHRLLHEMPKLMLYETWDLLHFDPTHNGVLTIHSRLGEQFSDDSGTRSDHYSEHFRLRSLRFPIGSPESLINSSWFKLINTNGMHIRVPRNLPIRPLFTDCFDLNNVEFREDEAKAIVRLKHNHS